ncbi:MAG: hypothetical protein J2P17_33855, partial [Mycobacterium sp.]|nr:hypothetical protein [Mycobacterium sp.]
STHSASGPMYNGRTDVTTWYTKRSGSAVQVRLGYYNNGYVWDDGPFWINAGEIRGYTWFGSYTADVCVTGEMLVMATNSLIPGGTVCP